MVGFDAIFPQLIPECKSVRMIKIGLHFNTTVIDREIKVAPFCAQQWILDTQSAMVN